MIAEDMAIDDTELDMESLRIPQLHNKYLNIYLDEKLKLSKSISDYNILYKLKWEYYTGKMEEGKLKELEWEPFQYKILRTDIDKYLDSDSDLIQKEHAKTYQEEKVKYLDAVIKNINNRQWNIRGAIDWRKFLSGTS